MLEAFKNNEDIHTQTAKLVFGATTDKEIKDYRAGDNTAQIQAAIDQVGALPLQADGYRGTVRLTAGLYAVDGTIRVNKTGGKIYTEMTAEARPKLIAQPAQNRGYTIKRHYARLGDDGKLSPAEKHDLVMFMRQL